MTNTRVVSIPGDTPGRTSSASRKSSQRGDVVIESALIFLPYLAMIFAVLDFSFAIFVQNTLSHAAREGVRYAVTQQTGGGGQDASIRTVVKQNAMGFLNAPGSDAYITLDYFDRSGAAVSGVGSNAAGNILILRVTGYPWTFFAPIWRPSSLAFSAYSADAMEAPPMGILPVR